MDTSKLHSGDVVTMMPLPVDEHGDYKPPMPAEAATDLGADDADPPPLPGDAVWLIVMLALSLWALWAVGSVVWTTVGG